MRATLVLLALVPLVSMCASPSDKPPSSAIECGIVGQDGQAAASETREFFYWDKAKEPLSLEMPLSRFEIDRAYFAQDHRGEKAVGFEIAPAQRASFSQFTKEHIGRRMACLVDGRILYAPTIEDVLPGSGILSGDLSDEEWDEVLALLSPNRH